ncbi:MAG TPA: hypothetical protein VEV17_16310 [Bryobacteraceae bacterium]|nr:hypothetical protein [Bryobacteraceae bacterium]
MKKLLGSIRVTLLALAETEAAQPIITDVVNPARRIPSGYPNCGIVQGALCAIVVSPNEVAAILPSGTPLERAR